jgi:hypothetical protein
MPRKQVNDRSLIYDHTICTLSSITEDELAFHSITQFGIGPSRCNTRAGRRLRFPAFQGGNKSDWNAFRRWGGGILHPRHLERD